MQPLDCELISGQAFRELFGQELSAERLESFVLQTHSLSAGDLQRRQDQDLFCLDWLKEGVRYTAGLQQGRLLFVNINFEPDQLPASQVIRCLGTPEQYQAWYESYLAMEFSSLHIALVFPARMAIAFGSRHFQSASTEATAIDDSLPVTMISLFGKAWEEDERALANSAPWPGGWEKVHVEVFLQHDAPVTSSRDQEADAWPGEIDEVLGQITQAFAGVPRPADDELLHPSVYNDSDIRALIGVQHWRELPDASVEYEYSALAFLSPTGFRHFLPAYLSWVLRHPESGAAVVGSTISALTPAAGDPLRKFMISKFSLLDDAQRAAVVSFLRAMVPFEDVRAALDYWLPRSDGE